MGIYIAFQITCLLVILTTWFKAFFCYLYCGKIGEPRDSSLLAECFNESAVEARPGLTQISTISSRVRSRSNELE